MNRPVVSDLERRRRWRLVLGEGPVVDPLDDAAGRTGDTRPDGDAARRWGQ